MRGARAQAQGAGTLETEERDGLNASSRGHLLGPLSQRSSEEGDCEPGGEGGAFLHNHPAASLLGTLVPPAGVPCSPTFDICQTFSVQLSHTMESPQGAPGKAPLEQQTLQQPWNWSLARIVHS